VAEGEYPADAPPQFDPGGEGGVWGGKPFANLARNPSAEGAGVRVRPWLDRLGARVFPEHTPISLLLTTILDWPGAGWYVNLEAQHLLRSLWAVFGWGHVRLAGLTPYRLPAALTALGILGAFLAAGRRWRKLDTAMALFILLALLAVWGQVLARGCLFVYYRPYFPPARNAYPAILLTALFLTVGWGELLGVSWGRWKLPAWAKYAAYFTFFLGFDLWAIFSIVTHYAG
ncbi:MAG: hypothetical protein L0Z70_07365, partial [Chloroflexi bacterium]|nr:hypothetical protein [Chloroflexota bacterium]